METAETMVRILAALGFVSALIVAGSGATRAAAAAPRRAIGAARSLRALPAYLLLAVPYFALWLPLWRQLPIDLGTPYRAAALVIGAVAGLTGLALYLGGRLTLGASYNVSSALGTEVCEGHRLVTGGPYRLVRHPMYAGLVLGAVGALLTFRTWTTVWILVALPGAYFKARREEQLLADEYGEAYDAYRRDTPGWIPRVWGRAGGAAGAADRDFQLR